MMGDGGGDHNDDGDGDCYHTDDGEGGCGLGWICNLVRKRNVDGEVRCLGFLFC